MKDLEKAQKVKAEFDKYIDWGWNVHDSANKAIEGHINGYEIGEYDYPITVYCGECVVLFDGSHSSIYKKLK
jgi:hypothetical protein